MSSSLHYSIIKEQAPFWTCSFMAGVVRLELTARGFGERQDRFPKAIKINDFSPPHFIHADGSPTTGSKQTLVIDTT